MNIKLQEIIWEITPECDRNCVYCGSKNVTKFKRLPTQALVKIAQEIAKYEVDEVTLSGGEPGTLAEQDPAGFAEIVSVLRKSGAKVKAVTNGKLLRTTADLSAFDVIGVSVNTLDEIKKATRLPTVASKRHTMITNFGTHNVWNFNELHEFAKLFGCWQVQLTMGDYQLQTDGIRYLREKLSAVCIVPSVSVVIADNLQETHDCSAGIRSCGVTHSGEVIACLSERSYGSCASHGSLLEKTLKEIWENGFKDIRFGRSCRKCCRDFISYPANDNSCFLPNRITLPKKKEESAPRTNAPRVIIYGVQQPPIVTMYGVTNNDYELTPLYVSTDVYMYGVASAGSGSCDVDFGDEQEHEE